MKFLTALVGILVLMLTAACGQQNTSLAAAASIDITVRAEPEPLAVGATTLIVTLKDAAGSPVDGANLRIHGDMDHQGMTPVDREVSTSTSGEYRVPFEWTMGGGWIVTVTAQLSGSGEVSETFDFFVEAVSNESIINRANNPATGDINITYQPDNNPAELGDAVVTITLADTDNRAITDARVEITGDMAHAGMMPITSEGEHTSGGQYVVPLHWTMVGEWFVTVKVTLADGRQFEQVFDQEVAIP